MPCKKFSEGVSRKEIEANFEKYRRGEINLFPTGALTCQEALPILKKYVLDPDPRIRELITQALATAYYDFYRSFYPQVFKLLLLQVEKFPLYKSAFPPSYAAYYPCYRFRKINGKQLTASLITRIKMHETAEDFDEIRALSRDELYLLGCLSRREKTAKDFLLEMWQPDYKTRLNEDYRQTQRELLFYALAEAGLKNAEEKVLADIDGKIATDDVNEIQSVLGDARSFTNCRIVKRYLSLITDKREISKDEYQNGEIKHLTGRVGDLAISYFISIYGIEATGERNVSFRAHTDAEMERFYGRIRTFVEKKVAAPCRLEK